MGDIRSNNWEDGIQVSILGLFEMPHFETLIAVSLLIVVFIYLFSCRRARRSDPVVKGAIVFDATSTISLSPVNFQYVSYLFMNQFILFAT